MGRYDDKLFKEAAKGPLSAQQIGEIVGCYPADALTRLRARTSVRVTVVAELPNYRGPRKLYKIERAVPIKGPYCCGYCDQQRRADLAETEVKRRKGKR